MATAQPTPAHYIVFGVFDGFLSEIHTNRFDSAVMLWFTYSTNDMIARVWDNTRNVFVGERSLVNAAIFYGQ